MLKKENRLLPPQQSNQRLKRNAGMKSKSRMEENLKVEELVKICGLEEKRRKSKEDPPRGKAKDLPEEEKALMVEENPGNRLEFGAFKESRN